MRRMRGAALLLVLWLILLLSGLVAGYAMGARVESLQGNGLVRTLAAREAARAGLEYAVARLLEPDPARRWAADGQPRSFTLADVPVQLVVRDEAGKIDLNAASPALLQGLFEALGQPRTQAAGLAAAIVDWRDPDHLKQPAGGAEDADYAAAGRPAGAKDAPFETVSELAGVLGMSPALVELAAAHLTVHSGAALPDATAADAVVRRAMGLPPLAPGQPAAGAAIAGSGTYSIDSRARLFDGRSVRLSVVLRLGSSGLPGSTYTPLHWQMGSAAK